MFAPGKDTLVIYHMMFPRWSKDPRAGVSGGKTAELPLVDQPCPSCTSVVDGLDGPAPHLSDRINLVVVAKTDPARLGTYARGRGWRNVRFLSSRNNTFNRDYHAETPEGEQLPVLNVYSRDEDGIHHRWASELTFVRGDSSPPRPGLADLGHSRPDSGRTRRNSCLSLAPVRIAQQQCRDSNLAAASPKPLVVFRHRDHCV
ncbi:DUF899 family protein [Prescottella soli]|uniref:DUF899 family protein n=1 Tax=Prescottella soli TaxID=1543852 RepID=A0ABW9FT07_9NOCA